MYSDPPALSCKVVRLGRGLSAFFHAMKFHKAPVVKEQGFDGPNFPPAGCVCDQTRSAARLEISGMAK